MSRRRLSDPFRFDLSLLESLGEGGQDNLKLAGADEAGRGCLAGPLVAAAVVLDYSRAPFPSLSCLTDSKLLSAEEREALYPAILAAAAHVSWVACSPATIDRFGLHVCNLRALVRTLELLRGRYRMAVVDGFDLQRPDLFARAVVGGDYRSASVAAASIVAKVVRDRLMKTMARMYPCYGFEDHVGYATRQHKQALCRYGPSEFHRLSFQGVATPQLDLLDDFPPPTNV
ncbi:MAG: ribonuclease HII [Thermoleophilia bacterium]|nr:ribonuclease HII [Thermoleophilia bacterium]